MTIKRTKLNKVKKEASTIGKIGGEATFKKMGKEHMSEIGRKGALSRWKKKRSV